MLKVFATHQFKAGNSQAVRIPADMAFPPKTELLVTRQGNKIIVEPREESLASVPALFASLKPHFTGRRPEFVAVERVGS